MLRDEKNALRQQYKQMRRELAPQQKEQMDRKIEKRICSLISFRYAKTVLLYYPKSTEIDTLSIMEEALRQGKQVGFPVTQPGGKMDFRLVKDPDTQMVPGPFGVPEPRADCPLFDKEATGAAKDTLVLVPGLSFDKDGYRLGYGNGYYDRYLENFNATSIGLVYQDFLAGRLPRGRYDRCVDLLVTEKGVKFLGKNERD